MEIAWDIREAISLKRARIIAFEMASPNFDDARKRFGRARVFHIEDRLNNFLTRLDRRIEELKSGDLDHNNKPNFIKRIKRDLEKTFPDCAKACVSSTIGIQINLFRSSLTTFPKKLKPNPGYRCKCVTLSESAAKTAEFAWLGEIYRFCDKVVSNYYKDLLDNLGITNREYCFHTSIKAKYRPHGFSHDSNIDGITRYYPGKPPQITIFLSIYFDKKSYLTLPFVVFHEAVCHAYQRVGARDGLPRDRPDHCRFAEGWMDNVALLMLEIALSELRGSAPEEMQFAAGEMIDEARKFHESRKQPKSDAGGKDRFLGAQSGRNAATAIWLHQDTFEEQHLSHEAWVKRSKEIFFEFSFLINICAGKREVQAILGEIDRLVPQQARSYETLAFARLVRQVLDTRDLSIFIEQLKTVPMKGSYY